MFNEHLLLSPSQKCSRFSAVQPIDGKMKRVLKIAATTNINALKE